MKWQDIEEKQKKAVSFSKDHELWDTLLVAKSLEWAPSLSFQKAMALREGQEAVTVDKPRDVNAFFSALALLRWCAHHKGGTLDKKDLFGLAALLGIAPLSWRQSQGDGGMGVKVVPAKDIDPLLTQFFSWLASAEDSPLWLAAESAHALLLIQPFEGRTTDLAQWMATLVLLRHGYPPPLLSKPFRGNKEALLALLAEGVEAATTFTPPPVSPSSPVSPLRVVKKEPLPETDVDQAWVKIGALAKRVGETVPTLRYWTKEGLLKAASITQAGYHLYAEEAVQDVLTIQKMKKRRLTLQEIKEKLNT
ncbi:MerR family transcriptional regulator [Candidatus Hepatobacter penaei]|uniref:helix-turn-helix domain-containing protein n=1 Tax=Candidatus Hepatobacter penaei TaxID=1274402 RepID=UPI0012E04BBE|nr:MerR family transcriptional regulator [Candidatus Hepatobacter penaei]